jgi:uncharacterized OsmC-like protein
MSTEKVINVINGVNVDAVNSTIEAIKGKPDIAKFRFHLHNNWINGGHNRSTVDSFYGANQENSHLRLFELDADEPPMLAGEDLGPNPVEHLLNALSACLTTSLIYHAAIRGIRIDELESELEGDIDLRGFLGLTNEVRKGYENIRVNFKVKTDEKNMEKLKALSKLSPVFDVTTHGTNVDIQIERK